MPAPAMRAIFQRLIDGDLALLRLAQERFRQAGLGAEFYPTSPDELGNLLRFRPLEEVPCTVHLPRDIRILEPHGRDRVCQFARRFPREVYGLVVHDQPEVADRFSDYVLAVRDLDRRLQTPGQGPLLFIEYAAGLEPQRFVALFEAIRDCHCVSACIDISHVGIRQCQRAYARRHPGQDVCRLKAHSPDLPGRVEEVQAACATALPVVLGTVWSIGRLGKPLHFHLHDGHPSSTFSPYGVSDHLSFFQDIPVPFAYHGSLTLPTLFGSLGLERVIAAAREALPDELLSFTLEVHPPEGRLPLGPYAHLFSHWVIKDNAERMNHWVEVLLRNHRLLSRCAGKSAIRSTKPETNLRHETQNAERIV